MICSLLRVIQLYVASTAIFSTSSTIYVDKNYQPVAVNYALVHPPSHINQTYTVVYQPEYLECFVKADMNPPQLVLNASLGMDSSILEPILINHTDVLSVQKPCKRSKPCKKTRPCPLSYPSYPSYPSNPATRPIVPPPQTPSPLTEISRVGPTQGASTPRPTRASPTRAVSTPPPTSAMTEVDLHPHEKDTYLSCVKAPQHLHGDIWSTAHFQEIPYHNRYPRILQCAAQCNHHSFIYYAMESGTRCWCAQSTPHAEAVHDSYCSPCSDDSRRTCGNVNYGFMSLYKMHSDASRPSEPSTPFEKKKTSKPIANQLTLSAVENIPTFSSKYVSKVLPEHQQLIQNHQYTVKPSATKKEEEDEDDDDEEEEASHTQSKEKREKREKREQRKRERRRRMFQFLKEKYQSELRSRYASQKVSMRSKQK